MINIFQIPQNDQSLYFLGQIFGAVGTVIPINNPNLLLGVLFKTINTYFHKHKVFCFIYLNFYVMLTIFIVIQLF